MADANASTSIRIDRLYLKDVGPFGELDLTLRPRQSPDKADLHVLVGPNGSGKSTILYALAAAFSSDTSPLIFSRLRNATSFACFRASYMGPSAGAVSVLLRTPRTPVREEPFAIPWSSGSGASDRFTTFLDPYSPLESYPLRARQFSRHKNTGPFSFAAFAYAGQRGLTSYRLEAIREPAEGPFANAVSFTQTANSATIVEWLATSHTREALALKDNNRAAAERYSATRTHVESAVREVIGEDIRFEMSYEPLGITLRRGGVSLDLDLLPDGVKSIVSWVADLLARLDRIPWENDTPVLDRPFLLLLDEVDIHLHPAWQRKVLPMVQRLFKNAQIVVSTHSPFVVSSVSDAWVYPFEVRDGVATLGEAIPSQAGSSVSSVLRSVFGVPEEFDVETESLLTRFYTLRDDVLAGQKTRIGELEHLARSLAARGDEVEDIVASEVLQVRDRLGVAP
jgi:predicted ATP-binding protein involved in virulence